jgi:hypothetical protein
MSPAVKVPLVVATGIICLALGLGLGALGMTYFGYNWNKPPKQERAAESPPPVDPANMAGMPGGGRPGMGNPGMGRPGMGNPGMGFPGMGAPNPKNQLVGLVTKLNQLTLKPLTVNLKNEQQQKLHDKLQGLGELDELSTDDAKKRLDAILEIVKDDKDVLEAAGYRWPGEGGGGFRPPADVPNPFKEDKNSTHLKALQERLDKPKG